MLPEPWRPDEPGIAVVVCTRNRAEALEETLDSIWAQTHLPEEVIIIDDGELPGALLARLETTCHGLGITWRYERSERPGLTRSRNRAAEIAESEILQYIDDDVTCDAKFLAEVARVMRDPLVAGVTATVEEPVFSTPSGRLYQLGYRMAGWWRVRPHEDPAGRQPSVLDEPDVAVRTAWLSGAAMALRRDIVRKHRFDETLGDYALGEDREMSFRLGPRHWLLHAIDARVVHRRDAEASINTHRRGFMSSFNYIRILRKTRRLQVGDGLLIGWNVTVLIAMHAAWGLVGPGRWHWGELWGMIDGLVAAFGAAVRERKIQVSRERKTRRRSLRTRPLHVPVAEPRRRKTRHVLFVTNRLEPGGAERMLISLVKRLPQYDVLPFVGCLQDAGPLAEECRQCGVPVTSHLLAHRTDAGVLVRIARLMAEHRIDVIVAAHSGGDRMFWTTLAGRLFGVPVVVWSHWFPGAGERHLERANRAVCRWVEAYVAPGRAQREALIRHEGVPAGRIGVIPNGVDVEQGPGDGPRSDVRRNLGLDDNNVAIAIIANLRREKRHDVFIEAARKAAGRNADLRFFLVGDGPLRDKVREAAARSGLEPEVLQLLGARDDVGSLLSAMDVSCLCSEQECFSVTMLEAAAAGCAFIGPAVGSIPEFLEHRRTGLAIRPADVDALADAMEEISSNGGLRRRLAAAARERVVRDHHIDRMVGAFSGLLHAMEGSHRGMP